MLTIQKDSTGKRYVEVPTLEGEHVRVTFVPKDDPRHGYKADSLRLQIQESNGRLRSPGTDVPLTSLGEFVKALDLLK